MATKREIMENHRSAHSHLLAENFLPFPFEGFSRRVLSAATEHVVFFGLVQNLKCKKQPKSIDIHPVVLKIMAICSFPCLIEALDTLVFSSWSTSITSSEWPMANHRAHRTSMTQWPSKIIEWIHFSASEPRRGLDLFLLKIVIPYCQLGDSMFHIIFAQNQKNPSKKCQRQSPNEYDLKNNGQNWRYMKSDVKWNNLHRNWSITI